MDGDEASGSHAPVVNICIMHGDGYIWNARDVQLLRTSHRIVGNLIGALARNPHQSNVMGLPLMLLPEEVTLLLEKGFANTITYPEMLQSPSDTVKEVILQQREKCYEEQVVAAADQRRKEIERVADTILKGKLKKLEKKKINEPYVYRNLVSELTREKVIEEELQKIQKLPKHLQAIQLFTEHPLINSLTPSHENWHFPSSESDKLIFAVFKDLWEQGYYITKGIKFGGDFLVYPGDPILYHAKFIVKCVRDLAKVDRCDIAAWSRIGTATKKTVVLAFLDSSKKVQYRSYEWTDEEENIL